MMNKASPYPLHCLQSLGSDFAKCIADATQAKTALVGPVVLAAMAAAVQGTVDIHTPFFTVMPASLYVSVIAESGMRKSTVIKHAFHGFRDFEAAFNGCQTGEMNFCEIGAHPYLWENTSESGIVSLFGNGAQAAAIVMDEGGMMAKHLDIQSMCKRFDGSDLRVIRKHQIIQIPNTRTTFCMAVQDAVYAEFLEGAQGKMMMPSGLHARNLYSFTKTSFVYSGCSGKRVSDPKTQPFNTRVRELMNDYRDTFTSSRPRSHIQLSPAAQGCWRTAAADWHQKKLFAQEWRGMKPFLERAGEQALRVAAVLQWFNGPKPMIDLPMMEAAVELVNWHLQQALIGLGKSEELVRSTGMVDFADALYSYMQRKLSTNPGGFFNRVDLLRKGPKCLRKAANLDFAIDQLVGQKKVILHLEGGKRVAVQMSFNLLAQSTQSNQIEVTKLTSLFRRGIAVNSGV